jgi:hypothetical protein
MDTPVRVYDLHPICAPEAHAGGREDAKKWGIERTMNSILLLMYLVYYSATVSDTQPLHDLKQVGAIHL